MALQSLVEQDIEDWILISTGENFHSVKKLNIHSFVKLWSTGKSRNSFSLTKNFVKSTL